MPQVSSPSNTGRPRLLVCVGASVDGRVTLSRDRLLMDEDASRVWRSLEPPSATALEAARSAQIAELYQPQAVLEGSGSLVRDSDGPLTGLSVELDEPESVLYSDFLPVDVVEGDEHQTWFTVVDSRGRVRWHPKGGGGFDVLVLAARATPPEYLAYLRQERICYLVVGEQRVDLTAALRRMQDRLGVTCVVSKAGGGLNGALLRADLVDEVHLLVYPALVGGLGTPTMFDGPELGHGEVPTRLRLLSTRVEADGMLWLRYEVLRAGNS